MPLFILFTSKPTNFQQLPSLHCEKWDVFRRYPFTKIMEYGNYLAMKVALVQISPHLGNLEKNFELHFKFLERARKDKVDLLVFPELSLTGYALRDLVEEVALNPDTHPLFQELLRASQDLSLVVGFVEEREKGIFYNSAAYLSRREIRHIHQKVFLPTFGMFEEGKFFAQGKSFRAFSTDFGRAGMLICRDFLHQGANYTLFVDGAEMIIVISSAPGRGVSEGEEFATAHMWELMGECVARFSTAFVLYCNRVGFEDGMSFAGGSFIFNPLGKLLAKSPHVDQDFLLHEINLEEIRKARKLWTFKRDERPEFILESLRRIIQGDEN